MTTTAAPRPSLRAAQGLLGLALAAACAARCGSDSPPGPAGTGGTSGTVTDAAGGSGGGDAPAADGNRDIAATDAGGSDSASDAAPDTATDGAAADAADGAAAADPMLLSETGLYADIAKGTLAPGVYAFQPQYPLWSDSATKRRWVSVPPGTKIDTSDMDFWDYPAGTKLWKEFTRDNVRIETRLLLKRSPGVWFMMAYKWNAQQTEAVAVPAGERNASNTQHDIPTKENCSTCHSPMWDFVLGFSALQLAHTLEGLNLDAVRAMGWLTQPPATTPALPGDAGDKAALGYLHANCGNCHNERSRVYNVNVDMDLWSHVDLLAAVPTTRAYLSTVCDQWSKNTPVTSCDAGHAIGSPSRGKASRLPSRIAPGSPTGSGIHELMSLRGDAETMRQMPPLGTEVVDTAGVAVIDAWITRLTRR